MEVFPSPGAGAPQNTPESGLHGHRPWSKLRIVSGSTERGGAKAAWAQRLGQTNSRRGERFEADRRPDTDSRRTIPQAQGSDYSGTGADRRRLGADPVDPPGVDPLQLRRLEALVPVPGRRVRTPARGDPLRTDAPLALPPVPRPPLRQQPAAPAGYPTLDHRSIAGIITPAGGCVAW